MRIEMCGIVPTEDRLAYTLHSTKLNEFKQFATQKPGLLIDFTSSTHLARQCTDVVIEN